MSKFAVLFRCKEVLVHESLRNSRVDPVMTKAGMLAWLVDSEGYWCGETFSEYGRRTDRKNIPHNVVTFESREKAEKKWPPFMRGESHGTIGPWWIDPDGWYEIVEIKPKFKQVPDGYEEVK
jgi:hypothetical protein